jgi:hypothetical protein
VGVLQITEDARQKKIHDGEPLEPLPSR